MHIYTYRDVLMSLGCMYVRIPSTLYIWMFVFRIFLHIYILFRIVSIAKKEKAKLFYGCENVFSEYSFWYIQNHCCCYNTFLTNPFCLLDVSTDPHRYNMRLQQHHVPTSDRRKKWVLWTLLLRLHEALVSSIHWGLGITVFGFITFNSILNVVSNIINLIDWFLCKAFLYLQRSSHRVPQ